MSSVPAVEVTRNADGSVLLGNVDSARVGEIAAAAGCVLHQLATRTASLEDAFFEATQRPVSTRLRCRRTDRRQVDDGDRRAAL